MDLLNLHNGSQRNTMNTRTRMGFKCGLEKQKPKARMQGGLSWIKPQMMQQVFSSIAHCEERKASEMPSQVELIDLFPKAEQDLTHCEATVGHYSSRPVSIPSRIANSRSVSTSGQDEESTAQLTIFYNGTVNVYDVSSERAQAITKLANTNNSRKTAPANTGGHRGEKSETCEDQNLRVQKLSGGLLPIARKLSLQRFLQKRKDRLNSIAPYMSTSTGIQGKEKEKDMDEHISLSLAFL